MSDLWKVSEISFFFKILLLFFIQILIFWDLNKMATTTLYLEDGTSYEGQLFGAMKNVTGEVGK